MKTGQWVHCTCGCGTTGRVLDMSEGEATIATPEMVVIYPKRALGEGALCFSCGKPAQVAMSLEEDEAQATFCLWDFARYATMATAAGMTYKGAYVLKGEDVVTEGAA